MIYQYNVKDQKTVKKLNNSKRFQEYPRLFLSNTCEVRVNGDDYLRTDEFVIQSKYKILPRKLYLYGKKQQCNDDENNLYLNYWFKVFFKTIEAGNLYKHNFSKSSFKAELAIGLPIKYRMSAFNYDSWQRENVITFLSCLFDNELEEVSYQQQDLLDDLLAA